MNFLEISLIACVPGEITLYTIDGGQCRTFFCAQVYSGTLRHWMSLTGPFFVQSFAFGQNLKANLS